MSDIKLSEEDIIRKREYAANASKKSREKKKLQRAWLLERNELLEKEQDLLKDKIIKLENEFESLQEASRKFRKIDMVINTENEDLRKAVKKRRTIIEQIKVIVEANSNDKSLDEEYLLVAKAGQQKSLKLLLKTAYSSAKKKGWVDLNFESLLLQDPIIRENKYFSKCTSITSKMKVGPSTVGRQRVSLRVDLRNLGVNKSVLTEACWQQHIERGKNSVYNKMAEFIRSKNGLEISFSQMKITEDNEKGQEEKSDFKSKQWVLEDGKKIFLIKTSIPIKSTSVSKQDILIVSAGEELVNPESFDYNFESDTGIEKVFLLSTSYSAAFKNKSEDMEYADDAYCFSLIVHNFEQLKDKCNMTMVVSRIDDGDVSVNTDFFKLLTDFATEDGISPMFGVLIQSLTKCIDSVVEKEKQV